jgi:hypothetical protein
MEDGESSSSSGYRVNEPQTPNPGAVIRRETYSDEEVLTDFTRLNIPVDTPVFDFLNSELVEANSQSRKSPVGLARHLYKNTLYVTSDELVYLTANRTLESGFIWSLGFKVNLASLTVASQYELSQPIQTDDGH